MLKFSAVALLALSLAQEKVENPEYKGWASFKPGSWVKQKMEMDVGQKAEGDITVTLIEVTPEKLILERKQSMTMAGQKMDLPVSRQTVDAKVEKGKAGDVKISEKEEEIEVGGKKLKCKLAETVMEANNQKMTGKVWLHPDIPGGMAQGEFSSAAVPKLKLVVTGWEKK